MVTAMVFELSLGFLFKGFNAPKFIIYLSLLAFVLLLALRLDRRLEMDYAFVFLPLWICHLLVFIGALVGVVSFCAHPPSRNDVSARVDLTAMVITTVEHLFICAFEILVYYKLQFDPTSWGVYIQWTIVFSPLLALALVSVVFAVWALRHDKPFEFEFFYAVNIIEFFFIAFKLDNQIDWSWAVVFIPLWVVLSLSAVGVLYALVLSIVLARSRHLISSHRRHHIYSAVFHTFLVVPALVCLVFLTGKLDALSWSEREPAADMSYTTVLFPLMISLFCLVLMSFGNGGGNVWWFGVRKPFCAHLMDTCPCLRQYANISYKIGVSPRESTESDGSNSDQLREELERPLRPIVPLTSIECVD